MEYSRARDAAPSKLSKGIRFEPMYGKFENFVALKFHRLVLAGGGGNARELESGIVAKEAGNAFAIYSFRFVLHTECYSIEIDLYTQRIL